MIVASTTSPEALDRDVARTLQIGGAPRVRKLAIRVALIVAALAAVAGVARWWR